MSGINALKNAARAAKFTTKAGKTVDLSRGFVVNAPDGTKIPFRAGTTPEQAKTWIQNFYRNDFEMDVLSETEEEGQKLEQMLFRAKNKAPVNRDEGVFADYPAEVLVMRQGDEYRIRNTFVDEGYRGKGIAAGMYRALFERAKKEGLKVVSDSRLSPQAVALWERFKELGYPIISYPKAQRGGKAGDQSDFIRAGAARDADLPLYEFDPLMKETPNIVKKQAGAAPGDEAVEATGALTKKQAE